MSYIAYIDTTVSDITLYSCLMHLNFTTYHHVAAAVHDIGGGS
jgi:hypothetical protein